ncbi:hypothetical protein C8J57DRAFT_1513970 [Mycena rebaudengoi]|nr:hypothetical protein C8J57DRAFT_1513970 [Mycena rebaudengoi]
MASASTVDTDETQNSSVPAIIEGYCYNKGLVKQTGETDNVKKTAPKPAAKYAIDIFSEEKKDQIAARVAELMEGADKAPGKNLTVWHTAREELTGQLDEKEKLLYQTIVEERNNKLRDGPSHEDIYRNQSAIFGPFVAGVYRDYLNDLRTFALSTQEQPGAAKFADHISDLMPDLHTGLKSWCQEVLLVALKDAGMVHVSIDESHEPRLHRWTEDTPLRRLLLEFAIGIRKWFKETVPEKTDGIVIKMDLKSEETTSSSSYEQHCPANMMSNH